jgi:hypothetical protein
MKGSKTGFIQQRTALILLLTFHLLMDSLPSQGTPEMYYSQNGILEGLTLISPCFFYDAVSFMIGEQ